MIQKLRERSGSESGFTLVELLVVMLILGLLAAIAIPSFFNQRDKARDADAKSGVRTAQTAIETWATDNDGAYNTGGGPDAGDLRAIESTLNDVDLEDPTGLTADGYTVTVTSENTSGGAHTFSITRAPSGVVTHPCSAPASDPDGCPSGGDWG